MVFSGSGAGTSGDPYIITTVDELQEMTDDLTAYYELGNDIEAYDTKWWNDGAGFAPAGSFSGQLNGAGFVIKDLYINRSATNYIGLFTTMSSTGVVKDLGLVNAYVRGNENTGGITGDCNGGDILRCFVEGWVQGSYIVGGICGYNDNDSLIQYCYTTGRVAGGNQTGGICGKNEYATTTKCYSKSQVTGGQYVGGICGFNNVGTVSYGYVAGPVSGSLNVNATVGYNGAGSVNNMYYDVDVTGISGSGTSLTTSEAKLAASYTTFNFSTEWDISPVANDGYPILQLIPYPDHVNAFMDIRNYKDSAFSSVYLGNLLCNPLGEAGQVMVLDHYGAGAWRKLKASDIDVDTTLNMNDFAISDVADPTLAQDAATKNYVDTQVANVKGLIPKTVRFDGQLTTNMPQQFSTLEVDATLTAVRLVLRGSLPTGSSIKVQVTKNGSAPADSVLASDLPIEITTSETAEANGVYVVEGTLDSGMTTCSKYDWFQATITQVGTEYAGNDLDVQLVFE